MLTVHTLLHDNESSSLYMPKAVICQWVLEAYVMSIQLSGATLVFPN